MLDQDLIEENTTFLLARWRAVNCDPRLLDGRRTGVHRDIALELRQLNELQVRRAADCCAPLFRFVQIEDVVLQAIQSKESVQIGGQSDPAVEEENYRLLLNRWASCRQSVVQAQAVLGLSQKMVSCLQTATLSDLGRAARRGVRLGYFAARSRYLFHAGRNPSLQRSQRTALAICNAPRCY